MWSLLLSSLGKGCIWRYTVTTGMMLGNRTMAVKLQVPTHFTGVRSALIIVITHTQVRASREESMIKSFRKGESRGDFTATPHTTPQKNQK